MENLKKQLFNIKRNNLYEDAISIHGEKTYAKVEGMIPYFKTIKIVDKIFNDFESRICKNCEHHTGVTADQGWWEGDDYTCKELKKNTHMDFGCNKFERKANDK